MAWGVPEIALILNATAVALGTCFGFWLNNVVKVQVDAKNATIEMLKTQNEKMSKETAPALAAQVKLLGESLESMAKTLQEEQKKYADLKSTTEPRLDDGVKKFRVQPDAEYAEYVNERLLAKVAEMQGTVTAISTNTESLLGNPAWATIANNAPGRFTIVAETKSPRWSVPGGIDTSKPDPVNTTKPKGE